MPFPLPVELIQEIVSHLREDTDTLRNLSSTARDFRSAAAHYRFSSLSLKPSEDFARLQEILTSFPTNASSVRSLRISFDCFCVSLSECIELDNDWRARLMLPGRIEALQSLSHLTHLELDYVRVPDRPPGFIQAYSGLLSLKLTSVAFADTQEFFSLLRCYPLLKTLHLRDVKVTRQTSNTDLCDAVYIQCPRPTYLLLECKALPFPTKGSPLLRDVKHLYLSSHVVGTECAYLLLEEMHKTLDQLTLQYELPYHIQNAQTLVYATRVPYLVVRSSIYILNETLRFIAKYLSSTTGRVRLEATSLLPRSDYSMPEGLDGITLEVALDLNAAKRRKVPWEAQAREGYMEGLKNAMPTSWATGKLTFVEYEEMGKKF